MLLMYMTIQILMYVKFELFSICKAVADFDSEDSSSFTFIRSLRNVFRVRDRVYRP